MRLLREVRIRARQALPQVLAACMVAYFAYHALHGDRGFHAWIMLQQEKAQVLAPAETVEAERARLERRAELLGSAHLDPHLLEERAKATSNTGAEGDHTLFMPTQL